MTLGEAKTRVLLLLDERKPKADLTGKLNRFFDMAQREVALYYPIWRVQEYGGEDERILPEDCFRPRFVIVDGGWFPYDRKEPLPAEDFSLRYELRPAEIGDATPDETELETQEEAIPAVLYLVAALTQEMEYDQRFFQSLYAQYQGKMANLADLLEGPVAVAEVEDGWI